MLSLLVVPGAHLCLPEVQGAHLSLSGVKGEHLSLWRTFDLTGRI